MIKGIEKLVCDALEKQFLGCLEMMVAKNEKIILHEVWGNLSQQHEIPIQKDTIFDIASITKVIATTLVAMVLVENKELELNDPIYKYLPQYNKKYYDQITVLHLLTHTSGLPDWVALYEPDWDYREAMKRLYNVQYKALPGSTYVYSCIGFIILTQIINLFMKDWTEFCIRYFFQPLKLRKTFFSHCA